MDEVYEYTRRGKECWSLEGLEADEDFVFALQPPMLELKGTAE